jgi:hypothetical protein
MVGQDDRCKIKLSMKRVDQETGQVIERPAPSSDREAG